MAKSGACGLQCEYGITMYLFVVAEGTFKTNLIIMCQDDTHYSYRERGYRRTNEGGCPEMSVCCIFHCFIFAIFVLFGSNLFKMFQDAHKS